MLNNHLVQIPHFTDSPILQIEKQAQSEEVTGQILSKLNVCLPH